MTERVEWDGNEVLVRSYTGATRPATAADLELAGYVHVSGFADTVSRAEHEAALALEQAGRKLAEDTLSETMRECSTAGRRIESLEQQLAAAGEGFATAKAKLTALQAELEQAKSTANAAAASLAKEIEAKCTERDRAEEAERHKAHDADIIAQLYAEHADLASQLAAESARSLPDDPLTDEMKALGEGRPEQAGEYVTRAELVEALQHVYQRTRNAAGETNMTGLLFKLVADRLEGK